MRFAFHGVITEDQQDPQSPRQWQLSRAKSLIEPDAERFHDGEGAGGTRGREAPERQEGIAMDRAPMHLNADEARQLTDDIRVAVGMSWDLIEQAYTRRAWAALGYGSWSEYCCREFRMDGLRLSSEKLPEILAGLRRAGMSLRAISAVTGESKSTVSRALAGVPNGTPETITGTDGKSYRAERATVWSTWDRDMKRSIDALDARQKARLEEINAIDIESLDLEEVDGLKREVQQMSEEWDHLETLVHGLVEVVGQRLEELTTSAGAANGSVGWNGRTHPMLDAIPLMTEEVLPGLVESIRESGLIHSGLLSHDGTMLDGRLRRLACEEVGVPMRWRTFEGDDEIGVILSLNVYRQHLTEDQRAKIAVRLSEQQR